MSKNGAVELPLWLARPLVLTQIAALDKSKMRGFDQRFRNDLGSAQRHCDRKLDCHTSLRSRRRHHCFVCSTTLLLHHWRAAVQIVTAPRATRDAGCSPNNARLFESALAKLLQETFAARYKLLLENAHNLRGADVSEFAARLSAEERRLFAAGQRASAQLLEWRGGTRRLDASTLLGSGKRRRMQ